MVVLARRPPPAVSSRPPRLGDDGIQMAPRLQTRQMTLQLARLGLGSRNDGESGAGVRMLGCGSLCDESWLVVFECKDGTSRVQKVHLLAVR